MLRGTTTNFLRSKKEEHAAPIDGLTYDPTATKVTPEFNQARFEYENRMREQKIQERLRAIEEANKRTSLNKDIAELVEVPEEIPDYFMESGIQDLRRSDELRASEEL